MKGADLLISLCGLLAVASGAGAVVSAHTQPATGHVRLLDTSGSLASVGLLQIRVAAEPFGTVCGMNLEAADVVCRQIGFDYGTLSSSGCSGYGGADHCGDATTPIAMKNLRCQGGEMDVQECAWEQPDASCGHASDAIVYCGRTGATGAPPEGSTRLLSHDGAPSIDGTGRLEVFRGGAWTAVCRAGFSSGAAAVACKAMGFAGVKPAPGSNACGTYHGANFCGAEPARISELACVGQEAGLLACPFKADDDVYCAAEENTVIACEGNGDTQGRGGH